MEIPIAAFFAPLCELLDLDPSATALSYDRDTGTLTVSGASGETLATGDELSAVYAQLHP